MLNKELINKIVWFIPNKNIRDFIRSYFSTINNINNIYDKVSNLSNKIDNIYYNVNIINFNGNDVNKLNYYDYIFSIGSNCFTAEMLRENNLRLFSSPFDWLTTWYNDVLHNLYIIENNFFNFFNNKEDFNFSSKSPFNTLVYFNNISKFYFPHDFISNFDVEFDKVKEKYHRRIRKTIDYLSSKRVLMVYIDITSFHNERELEVYNILNLLNRIRQKYNNDNIDLLYLHHSNSALDINNMFIDNRLHLYILNNFSYNTLTENYAFIGNEEKTSKILSNFKVKKSDILV